MLFSSDLEEIIFNRHEIVDTDEMIVLSGYLGPAPVNRLEELPFDVTVIYGMYGSDKIKAKLHSSLVELDQAISNINILYSKVPVHSKCYAWKKNDQIIHALIGSANFSTNGLKTPFKEVLAETTRDTFNHLNSYINTIIQNSIVCFDHNVAVIGDLHRQSIIYNDAVCTMTLLDPRTDEVQNAHGLNWGQSHTAHVTPNDACIPIRAAHIRNYPNLFPPKQFFPRMNSVGRVQRHNDIIEIIWDDGTRMQGLLEGNYPIEGVNYPKQIASSPQKSLLGAYIRRRIEVPSGLRISKRHLDAYGRTNVDVSLQAEGVYYFDFSV